MFTRFTRNNSPACFRGCLIAALLCSSSGQSPAAPAKDLQQLASANARFAFNLLNQLVAEQPGSNIFISPYSVSTVLQMVSTGAAGTTKTQMDQALGVSALQPSAVNEGNQEIGGILNRGNTNFVLSAANAVWFRSGTPLYPSFISGDEQFFGATVQGLNFNDPSSVTVINDWASQETHGKIDRIVSSPIPADVRMFLANAVYFLGTWETPFDTNSTTDQPFQLNGGGEETIPLMRRLGTFSYGAGNGFQMAQLPYKGGDLAMYVFLPGPGSSLTEFLGQMNGAWWQQAVKAGFTNQWGIVALPKFNLNCATDLKPPLEALGMETAFTPHANFSKISSLPLYISAVRQQAVVEVNELGTEAAAVTTVTVVIGAVMVPPPPQFEMIVDRPFLFVIQDQQAGTILFMGAVFDP